MASAVTAQRHMAAFEQTRFPLQWNLLRHHTSIVSVVVDEATRLTFAGVVLSKGTRRVLASITNTWPRQRGFPRI